MKKLEDLIDDKCYNKLVCTFGGRRIWIPKKGNTGYRDKDYINNRNKGIISLFRQGKKASELAESFQLSEKSIYAIVKGIKSNKSII